MNRDQAPIQLDYWREDSVAWNAGRLNQEIPACGIFGQLYHGLYERTGIKLNGMRSDFCGQARVELQLAHGYGIEQNARLKRFNRH
jgi:hypothetical protein